MLNLLVNMCISESTLSTRDAGHDHSRKANKPPSFFPSLNDYYRLSTSTKCIAAYPSTKNTPQYTAKPTASDHSARLLNPKELKMADPGTSISRPYFLSTNDKEYTSLTMRPSNP